MSDRAKGSGGELVEFPKGSDAVEISIGRWRPREPSKCRHFKVALREDRGSPAYGIQRSVECRDCGEALDPFEVLWRYAKTDDKLRRQREAWANLGEAWAWLWDNRATLSISRGGVKAAIKVGGKRRTRTGSAVLGDGLPALIISTVEALKGLKRWGG